jgi:hypothetical protein
MGLETVGLRYFNVFGPHQDPKSQYSAVIPLFITAIMEGRQPTIYGDGLQTRDFAFVANNVQANILAATTEKPVSGKIINIACGTSFSLLDLLKAINEALNFQLSNPSIFVEPIFEPARKGDVKHSLADISLARELLNYEVNIDFSEGIKRTVEWYLKLNNISKTIKKHEQKNSCIGADMSVVQRWLSLQIDVRIIAYSCYINPARIAAWNSDHLPIYEPGHDTLVKRNRVESFFDTEIEKNIKQCDIIFVSVNTRPKTFGNGAGMAADLQYWEKQRA